MPELFDFPTTGTDTLNRHSQGCVRLPDSELEVVAPIVTFLCICGIMKRSTTGMSDYFSPHAIQINTVIQCDSCGVCARRHVMGAQ